MKKILITNDDGIRAPVLDLMREKFSRMGKVTIVVPDAPRNAMGNSITLHKPVRLNKLDSDKYSVTGTTADSVRVGVLTVMEDDVDIVLSGINEGANLGDDVNYSGTVAGAREAAHLGIPAVASSLVAGNTRNYSQAVDITYRVIEKVLDNGLPERKFLNLNIPDIGTGRVKGIKITRLGVRIYDRKVVERKDPIGRKYYWILGDKLDGILADDTDLKAVSEDYASLTPLTMDYTDRGLLEKYRTWFSE
ncbi:MAG: 5'/3'-nucleotidase SurE [Elusimicrobia bacterium]|nr:5'/3'-nucleotidase SurE [Elusimicrobiota bacterium]